MQYRKLLGLTAVLCISAVFYHLACSFLLLYSSNSASKKGYVQKEAKIAIELFSELPPDEIFIIPIRLDNIELPEKFENLHWVDLFPSYNYGLNEILKVLKNKKNK